MSYDDELAQDKKDLRILTEIGRRNGVAAGSAVQGETPVNNARPAELSAACEAEILTRLDRSNPDVCALIAELARVRQERQFILDEDKRRAIVADAAVKAADDAIAQLADLRRKLGELADTTREVMKLIDDGYLIRYQQWHDAAKGAR